MKKLFNYALIGAIALTGSTMLTSCSSSDDAAAENNNPNYDPDTQTVYAQFVFNVASGSTATTRQSEAATQASSSLTATEFRGIDNSHVMCFINGRVTAITSLLLPQQQSHSIWLELLMPER